MFLRKRCNSESVVMQSCSLQSIAKYFLIKMSCKIVDGIKTAVKGLPLVSNVDIQYKKGTFGMRKERLSPSTGNESARLPESFICALFLLSLVGADRC